MNAHSTTKCDSFENDLTRRDDSQDLGQNARDLSRDIAVDEKLNPQTSAWLGSNYEEYKKLDEQGLVDKPNVGQAEKQENQADNQSKKHPDWKSPNQQNAHKSGDKPDRIVADLDSKAQSIGHSPKLNNHYKNPEVKLSTWDKIGSNLPSLPDNMVNFVAGMGDFISFGATEWVRDKADIDGGVNANSKSYKAGEVAGLTVGLVSGGSLATVGAKTISGKVARVTTATIAADVAGRAATGSFSIQYDEQQCNALNKMSSRKSPWIDGSKPLRTSDLTDEHNFLQEVGVAKKLPNGGSSYEVNGVDMAYVLTENRFARSAGKTGLSLGKVTQIPATVMGVVGSDVYSLYTSIGNPKGTRINEIKTDLKGTYMGAVLSLSKDMQTGVDAKCNKPNKKR